MLKRRTPRRRGEPGAGRWLEKLPALPWRRIGLSLAGLAVIALAFSGLALLLNQPLQRHNYREVLEPLIGSGDFLLNLSVDVSSMDLVKLCWEKLSEDINYPAFEPA